MSRVAFWNKKIPTIFGVILLVIAVLTTSYLVNTGVIYLGGAAPSDNPQDVRITNLTDSSFTVTYHTAATVIGTISVGETKDSLSTILDERDQQAGVPQQYTLHSITVEKLKPETQYIFSITSGTTTYQNNGSLFTAKTFATISEPPLTTVPLSGSIAGMDNTKEAFVFVTTKNGQTVSGLVKSNGIYIIPLNTFRTLDGKSYLTLADNTVLQLLATNGTDTSQVQLLASGDNPVPTITLGQSYNFITGTTPIASTSASLGFPAFPSDNTLLATPVITTPTKDESFTDPQPQFTGRALPNQDVTIQIHSDALTNATVKSDASGNWTFRPTTPLSPGQHIISITTKNAAGILQTIEQSFTVYASGTQVNQSATPSATLAPSPTAKPTSVPTSQPGVTITPTTVVIPAAAVSITPGTTAKPTPRPTLPPTGSNSLIVSSALALAVSAIGVVLFIITKSAAL